MPLRIWRILTLLGRPPGLAGGIKGSRMAHSASERSLAYGFIGVLSPSLSTSFSFICLYCTTFPASDVASPNLFPGLLAQPLSFGNFSIATGRSLSISCSDAIVLVSFISLDNTLPTRNKLSSNVRHDEHTTPEQFEV